MKSDIYSQRRKRCTKLMQATGFDALLLANPANLFYLTGDRRLHSFAFISRSGEVGMGVPMTDLEDARQTAYYDYIVGFDGDDTLLHAIDYYFVHSNLTSGMVGMEFDYLTARTLELFSHERAKPPLVAVADCSPILAEVRSVKDAEEVAAIRTAARVAMAGMNAALTVLRAGISENQIAAEAECGMRGAGAQSFETTYVQSGLRTQIAHGVPGDRLLAPGDLVVIDLHPIVDGYHADLCRTLSVGEASVEQQAIYDLYVSAQQDVVNAIRPGADVEELCSAMLRVLARAGYDGLSFGKLIHGIGVELNEAPLDSGVIRHECPQANTLVANQVLSVGNSVLHMASWGVRVEDTVLVTGSGSELLTDCPRRLIPPN